MRKQFIFIAFSLVCLLSLSAEPLKADDSKENSYHPILGKILVHMNGYEIFNEKKYPCEPNTKCKSIEFKSLKAQKIEGSLYYPKFTITVVEYESEQKARQAFNKLFKMGSSDDELIGLSKGWDWVGLDGALMILLNTGACVWKTTFYNAKDTIVQIISQNTDSKIESFECHCGWEPCKLIYRNK